MFFYWDWFIPWDESHNPNPLFPSWQPGNNGFWFWLPSQGMIKTIILPRDDKTHNPPCYQKFWEIWLAANSKGIQNRPCLIRMLLFHPITRDDGLHPPVGSFDASLGSTALGKQQSSLMWVKPIIPCNGVEQYLNIPLFCQLLSETILNLRFWSGSLSTNPASRFEPTCSPDYNQGQHLANIHLIRANDIFI